MAWVFFAAVHACKLREPIRACLVDCTTGEAIQGRCVEEETAVKPRFTEDLGRNWPKRPRG
jgi:hypothetical protein